MRGLLIPFKRGVNRQHLLNKAEVNLDLSKLTILSKSDRDAAFCEHVDVRILES